MIRILAATDFSPAGRHAVERASRLAGELGGELYLAHAIRANLVDDIERLLVPDAPPIAVTLGNDASRQLQGIADELAPSGAECKILFGKPVDALLEHADAIAADLLVVGSRGAGNLRQLSIGTTALRLLRQTRRPTLVVKRPPAGPYRRVLLAMDFSPAALAALRRVRQIAPNAELTLLHAVDILFAGKMQDDDDDVTAPSRSAAQVKAMQQLRHLADTEREAAAHLLAPHGNPAEQILAQAVVQDCDLIVVGKRGLSIVEELLLGSTTKHLLLDADCDMLVVSGGPEEAA